MTERHIVLKNKIAKLFNDKEIDHHQRLNRTN